MLIKKFNEYCSELMATQHPVSSPMPEAVRESTISPRTTASYATLPTFTPSPTPSPPAKDLSGVTTADLWGSLSMIKFSWNPLEWITVRAKSNFFIDSNGLQVIVQVGSLYGTYGNSDPMHINVPDTLAGAAIELPLRKVTDVTAKTPEGTMHCERHQTSDRYKLVYACVS